MKVKKVEYCVRLTITVPPPDSGRSEIVSYRRDHLWFDEVLRYAGISRRIGVVAQVGGQTLEVYELRCPTWETEKPDTFNWASQNAERMKSFGLVAVAAERWNNNVRTCEGMATPPTL